MPRKIKTWEELVDFESQDYKLEIDLEYGCGWIRPKVKTKENREYHVYLSTHTFYESNYKGYEKLLRSCGFNITLESWG